MQPGGINEMVSRFIGHLHMAEESARLRIEFEEFSNGKRGEADHAKKLNQPGLKNELEELASQPVRSRYASAEDELDGDLALVQKLAAAKGSEALAAPLLKPLPPFPAIPNGGGGGGSAENTFYRDIGGDDRMVDVDQLNHLIDDDVSLASEFDVSSLVKSHDGEIQHAFELAVEEFPSDLPTGSVSSVDFIEWAGSRSADELANREPSDNALTLEAGRYINGEKVEASPQPESSAQAEPTLPEQAGSLDDSADGADNTPDTVSKRPELSPPEYEYGVTDSALVVQTGGNVAQNVGQIIDLDGAAGTMVVMGNLYKTNAIYQTNVYSDHDDVSQYGPGEATVETAGNIADNVAELIRSSDSTSSIEFIPFEGMFIHVDRIEGDFYDVKLLTQTNLLQDNDVITHSSFFGFTEVDAGQNVQVNAAFFENLFSYYDMVIIGGNCYSANLIYQMNVVLDDDVIIMSQAEGADAEQSIDSGQNWLYNSATIQDLGADATPWSGDLDSFSNGIAHGQGNVNVSAVQDMPGNGSEVLNVLYITGDYYGLNLISQLNIILDADVAAVQFPGGTEGFLQYVSTGNNGAANYAEIATVGALDGLFVGGEIYEDSLLVQAEIVDGDEDTVNINPVSDLPPEVVAFTSDDSEATTTDSPGQTIVSDTPVAPLGDILSGMLN